MKYQPQPNWRGARKGRRGLLFLGQDFFQQHILKDDGQCGIGPAESDVGAEERGGGGQHNDRYDNGVGDGNSMDCGLENGRRERK